MSQVILEPSLARGQPRPLVTSTHCVVGIWMRRFSATYFSPGHYKHTQSQATERKTLKEEEEEDIPGPGESGEPAGPSLQQAPPTSPPQTLAPPVPPTLL